LEVAVAREARARVARPRVVREVDRDRVAPFFAEREAARFVDAARELPRRRAAEPRERVRDREPDLEPVARDLPTLRRPPDERDERRAPFFAEDGRRPLPFRGDIAPSPFQRM
jgi:hypothetical protein